MKLHRFIGNFDFSQKIIEITNPENIKQIKDVLRLKNGNEIILSDGNGKEVQIKIIFFSKKKIKGEVIKKLKANKINKKVILSLAILKKENFEWAVQKAVECGVSEIIPIITERTIKTGLKIHRLEKIIKEASEQCGQSMVPILHKITNFKNTLKICQNTDEKIIFHLTGTEYTPNKNTKNVCIFVGPEGGFTDKEISLAENSGYKIISLGSFTLRGETAAIVASYRAVNGI